MRRVRSSEDNGIDRNTAIKHNGPGKMYTSDPMILSMMLKIEKRTQKHILQNQPMLFPYAPIPCQSHECQKYRQASDSIQGNLC